MHDNSMNMYGRVSPLRRSQSPHDRVSPPNVGSSYEDNQARMRKSQERIAAILGFNGAAQPEATHPGPRMN